MAYHLARTKVTGIVTAYSELHNLIQASIHRSSTPLSHPCYLESFINQTDIYSEGIFHQSTVRALQDGEYWPMHT